MMQIICSEEHEMIKSGWISTSSWYDEKLHEFIHTESQTEYMQCKNCSYSDRESYKTIYDKIMDSNNNELRNYEHTWMSITG